MTELIEIRDSARAPATMQEAMGTIAVMQGQMDSMRGMMAAMAEMIRANNEQISRMGAAMQQLAMRQPVSRVQAAALNRALKDRAAELCSAWGCPAAAAAVVKCIRRDVRAALASGAGVSARSMSDVPACQYQTVMEMISRWDDLMIRRKARKGEL